MAPFSWDCVRNDSDQTYNPYDRSNCLPKTYTTSDHKPLRELLGKKETSAKLARWALYLQDYDIVIDYRDGKVNQNADCLSRIPETMERQQRNLKLHQL